MKREITIDEVTPIKTRRIGRFRTSLNSGDDLMFAGNVRRFIKDLRAFKPRFYTTLILDYLTVQKEMDEKSDKQNGGWVRANDIRKKLVGPEVIPNSSTFYHLLGDLVDAALIERRSGQRVHGQRGGCPAYYRVTRSIRDEWYMAPMDILAEYYVACGITEKAFAEATHMEYHLDENTPDERICELHESLRDLAIMDIAGKSEMKRLRHLAKRKMDRRHKEKEQKTSAT